MSDHSSAGEPVSRKIWEAPSLVALDVELDEVRNNPGAGSDAFTEVAFSMS